MVSGFESRLLRMAKETLRLRAYRYLKARPGVWVNSGELERLAMGVGYKGSTVSRRLRELAEESSGGRLEGLLGTIEAEEKKGDHSRSVWYRWVGPAPFDLQAERRRIDQAFDEYVTGSSLKPENAS